MGFLSPKPPKVIPAPTTAQQPTGADATTDTNPSLVANPSALINTSPQGLTTKARGSRTSLIGGVSQ